MKLNAYQEAATGTAIYPGKGAPLGLTYVALKMNGEAGEFAEHLGKAIRDDGYGQPMTEKFTKLHDDTGDGHEVVRITGHAGFTIDRQLKLKKELGDVLWYIAAAATELGFTLEDIAQGNLDKLAGRKAAGTLGGSGDDR